MGVSDLVYMVRGATREECQAGLDELCQRLGAVPTLGPLNTVGPGWVARAVCKPKAPAAVGDGIGSARDDRDVYFSRSE